jgi:hypothetical protein
MLDSLKAKTLIESDTVRDSQGESLEQMRNRVFAEAAKARPTPHPEAGRIDDATATTPMFRKVTNVDDAPGHLRIYDVPEPTDRKRENDRKISVPPGAMTVVPPKPAGMPNYGAPPVDNALLPKNQPNNAATQFGYRTETPPHGQPHLGARPPTSPAPTQMWGSGPQPQQGQYPGPPQGHRPDVPLAQGSAPAHGYAPYPGNTTPAQGYPNYYPHQGSQPYGMPPAPQPSRAWTFFAIFLIVAIIAGVIIAAVANA